MLLSKAPHLHSHLASLSTTSSSSPPTTEDSAASLTPAPTEPKTPPSPEPYLSPLFATLLTSALAVDEASRLWDVYVFEGDSLLIRAAVALLLQEESAIMLCKTPEDVRVALTGGADGKGRVVGEVGAEDRWMKAVWDAGKS